MKRQLLLLTAVAMAAAGTAQTLNVKVGSVTYAIPAAQAGEMIFTDGNSLTVMGKTLSLSSIEKMYVDDSTVSGNTVSVVYDGAEACVTVAGNIARYVETTVSGARVSITQGADVGDDTCGEITYQLSGASADGAFTMEGDYKASLELLGLTLANTAGAPITIDDGKRISLSVKSGTVNTLADCSGGSQKGAIDCKGHLELKGKGTLNVAGSTAHAIYAKEYIEMKNCTVNITAAVKDGVNCNQYFAMESGSLSISGTGDDGIQVSYKDETDREAEDTGSITISGGTVTAAVTATAAKALKAEGNVTVTGGTLDLSTSGGGTWDTEDSKTKAAACVSADEAVRIDGGTLTMTSTGSGGKGISADGELTINGGDMTIKTSGGLFAYVNGTVYDNYTGNSDNIQSDYKSSPKGIKADGNVTINGGTISVTTTGNGSEGIESKAVLTINDGTITVNSYDDAINSSSHLYIKGGDVTVVATNNDGLDSNGNLYISGGVTRAFGGGSPECGIDANTEGGYGVYITGGTLLAVGGSNSLPKSATQAYVSASASATAGSTVTLSNGSTTLATFTVPDNYSSSSSGGSQPGGRAGWGGPGGNKPGGSGGGSMLITCPGLTSGTSYTLTSGATTTTVTAK